MKEVNTKQPRFATFSAFINSLPEDSDTLDYMFASLSDHGLEPGDDPDTMFEGVEGEIGALDLGLQMRWWGDWLLAKVAEFKEYESLTAELEDADA